MLSKKINKGCLLTWFKRQPVFVNKKGVRKSWTILLQGLVILVRDTHLQDTMQVFLAIDYLAQFFNTKVDKIKFKGLVGSFEYAGKKVLLLKPMTYMNASGESIIEAVNFYKIKPEKLIVIYDDIAFDVGVVKMRKKGSDGGHNGIKSIIQCLGTEEFPRIRIGIGVPKYDMVKYVLSEFEDGEKEKIFRAIEKASNGIKILLESDIDRAMNYINGDVVV